MSAAKISDAQCSNQLRELMALKDLRQRTQNNELSKNELREWTKETFHRRNEASYEASGRNYHTTLFSRFSVGENGFGFTFRTPRLDDIEEISRRYADAKNYIKENFDTEEKRNEHLGKLNQAFEDILREISRMEFGGRPFCVYGLTELDEFFLNLESNLNRHLDNFFVTFINALNDNDFDIAFGKSMDKLNSTQTTSFSEISFGDLRLISEAVKNTPIDFDEEGNTAILRHNNWNDVVSSILRLNISEYIRDALLVVTRNFHDWGQLEIIED